MYVLSRILLMVAASAGLGCAALLAVVAWPASGVVAALVLVGHIVRRRRATPTTLGSARWASASELRTSGMMDAASGLILGRTGTERESSWTRLRRLFDRRMGAEEACHQVWTGLRRGRGLVRLPNAIHTAVFSPSGGGKGVSCVLPFLRSERGSCVVVDFKGENAAITAGYRRKRFGHRVVLLDPFKVVTLSPDTFNPLDFIDKDSPYAIDYCNDLANALVIKSPEAKEPHWDASAEAFVAAMLATVVQYGDRGESRSLQTVRDFLSHPQKLDMALRVMGESDCWGGMLARMGGQLGYFVEKEKNSTLTTVGRHLRFLDTLAVADSTKSSSFDPGDLRKGKMTVFLILPPDFMRSQSALLRVWIGSLLRAVVAGGLQEKNKVHFILDEAASLGHLEAVDDAVDKYRGYGVRLQLYFQSLGQLRKCFPEGQEQTLLSNATQVYFGVNDNATADNVSARLGEQTVIVDSGGRSSGSSSQWSDGIHSQHSGGQSSNSNSNWAQQARRLLKPEEVMALPPRTAITFTPGTRPICTTLLRYYEEKPGLWRGSGIIRRAADACATLVLSTVLCAGSMYCLVASAEAFARHMAQAQRQDAAPHRVERKGSKTHGPGVPVRRR